MSVLYHFFCFWGISLKTRIIVLVFALIATGCANLPNVSQIQPPQISFYQVKVDKINSDELQLLVSFNVNNPNNITINDVNFDYDLAFEGNRLASGDAIKLDALSMGKQVLVVPVNLAYKDIITNGDAVVQLVKSGRLSFNAQADVAVYGKYQWLPTLYQDYRYEHTAPVDVPLPSLSTALKWLL